ncbi:hypothetical protein MKW98_020909 [Papaver atlanticum]|uniref:FBD domain-containing protein n=1 Tax=Papaver atlanticum TaxID=357466 RepID=A0AAD4XWH6_9MAGN|nr:hypothetical protein MKW98_020909 [Papaver atlanticum]
MLRDNSNIHSFRFRWSYFPINNGVRRSFARWIDAVVERNVQEVTLEIRHSYSKMTYEIPPGLVNCKSLKKLTLRVEDLAEFILPKSMSLPQLKFMCLDGFLVSNEESAKNLFSCCPLLETLNIVDCYIQTDNRGNFTVESLSLKHFAYTHRHNNYRRHHLRPTIIKLSAPNLTSITCESYLTQEYDLQNCSDLSDINLNILYNKEFEKRHLPKEEKEEYAKRILKLLVSVKKVKRLDLSSGFLEVLWRVTDLYNCQLPILCNLQSLRLETRFTRGSMHAIAYLLKISPNISTFIVKSNSADVGDDWEVGFSLSGMVSNLNVVRIENVHGCDAELKILSYLLKNAKGLKKVVLYFRPSVGSSDRVRQVKLFKKKLIEVPTASSSIGMVFY